MKVGRYATSRQKACSNCSAAKAKCDRKPGRCSRCRLRDLQCAYKAVAPSASPIDTHGSIAGNNGDESIVLSCPPAGAARVSNASWDSIEQIGPVPNATLTKQTSHTVAKRAEVLNEMEDLDLLAFDARSESELVCPINADEIKNRWLNIFVPNPEQKSKEYPPTITAFIYRILRSYASVIVRGRGLPSFVHASQARESSLKTPLRSCLDLVRKCDNLSPSNTESAVGLLEQEMSSLYEQHETYDDITLLSAFQAYLLYSMVLFFSLDQGSNPLLRTAMMNLQHLTASSSRKGLVCIAEQCHACPSWKAWTIAEAKRRTLFTMYLFDSVLAAQDGLPTMLGIELQGLPAPSSKSLWSAKARPAWKAAYENHLADWATFFRIDELWPIPQEMNKDEIIERRQRVDQWLENVDEFGMMIYTVTSCTHGG